MKFRTNTRFNTRYGLFEENNEHDSEVLGIEHDDLARWHAAGFIEVDGWDPAPAIDPANPVTLTPENTAHGQTTTT